MCVDVRVRMCTHVHLPVCVSSQGTQAGLGH